MKALKPMTVKIGFNSFRLAVNREIPQVVVDFWKKTNQISELIKSKFVSDDGSQKTTNVNPVTSGDKK